MDNSNTTQHEDGHQIPLSDDPFHPAAGSDLDSNSTLFDVRKWLQALHHLESCAVPPLTRGRVGIAFSNLYVHGEYNLESFQNTVGNVFLNVPTFLRNWLSTTNRTGKTLLDSFDGIICSGEMLLVLGAPGSGCSTFLKTIAGDVNNITIDDDSYVNYQGLSSQEMRENFRGEAIYTAEHDVHFPMLTVKDTLKFAVRARAPNTLPGHVDAETYEDHMCRAIMAMFKMSHTENTRVGSDHLPGVSGGERRRVTIAEATLSGCTVQCWDNCTRGLDAVNAIELCKAIRTQSDILGVTALVSSYQTPQEAFEQFDKVLLIHKGKQFFFGTLNDASEYFYDIGFERLPGQTSADYLTSITNESERKIRPGYEDKAPRSIDDLESTWKSSSYRLQLLNDIKLFDAQHPINGASSDALRNCFRNRKARIQGDKSPYMLSNVDQTLLCLWRGILRLKADPTVSVGQFIMNGIVALVVGSLFYNLTPNTKSFAQRGSLIFFTLIMNAIGSSLEVLLLYEQRPIVEKHLRYAFNHPWTEAFSSILIDIPYKVGNAVFFNVVIYMITNLRREPGAFFFFLLTCFLTTLAMSMMFRLLASMTRSLEQALVPTGIMVSTMALYAGFVIPTGYMLDWGKWIHYLNPAYYAFESLMINEFHDRKFDCSTLIPAYTNSTVSTSTCAIIGSIPGELRVNGDAYISSAYDFHHDHKWRNVGILLLFALGSAILHLLATEFITSKGPRGEILVFGRSNRKSLFTRNTQDVESSPGKSITTFEKIGSSNVPAIRIAENQCTLEWRDLFYSIKGQGKSKENRDILNGVDGWVEPGTITALMGVSGAGKTTLLNALADRLPSGILSGNIFVNGEKRASSFERTTGYVQQHDIHLPTDTVREALVFSALLRLPASMSKQDKLNVVEETIQTLNMQSFSDAIVGSPGNGLNIEQRRLLSIGVELVAKPGLLFLDEPTSGLDSATAWSICSLLEKLRAGGQTILCTIHQPSAPLFAKFDRLILLGNNGRVFYFGNTGPKAKTVIDYFERTSGTKCPSEENPAEWLLKISDNTQSLNTNTDWGTSWRESQECVTVRERLLACEIFPKADSTHGDRGTNGNEYSSPFFMQLLLVTSRMFRRYWRSPSYIYSKFALVLGASLLSGFSLFQSPRTLQGLSNQLFSIFMLFTIFGQLTQQIMPIFVTQRSLYEARERSAKLYSWKIFVLANVIVEIPWQLITGLVMFLAWYYPVGLYHNAENATSERGSLMFLLIVAYMLLTSTFAQMFVSSLPNSETASGLANLSFTLCLIFCGILVRKDDMPGFWIFMYRISPFTYLSSGMLSAGLADTNISCASNEYLFIHPNEGQTCEGYLKPWIAARGGYVANPLDSNNCRFCPISDTNMYLSQLGIHTHEAWRNLGLLFSYVGFNIIVTVFLYWSVRVPRNPMSNGK